MSLIISTPDRDRARAKGDLGPPGNLAHVQEWNFQEFSKLLAHHDIPVIIHGHTRNFSMQDTRNTQVALADARDFSALKVSKSKIKLLALLPVYNEIDIIEVNIRRLQEQGIDVYVIDNWSDDGSYEKVLEMQRQDKSIQLERFPDGPTPDFRWKDILSRMEELSMKLEYDWFIHVDADEFIESYSSSLGIVSAVSIVDRLGFNSIDFTLIDFRPTNTSQSLGSNLPSQWEFATRSGAKQLQRCWKKTDVKPDFASSGGHVNNSHQKIFPLNFLLLHLPVRSLEQGRKKILMDRLPRFLNERKLFGWHTQYDSVTPEADLVWDEDSLIPLDFELQSEYLPEIVARCNIFDKVNNQ